MVRNPPKPPIGALAHFEVLSNEPEATKSFYRTVFGWKFDDVPEMDYSLIETGGQTNGGLMRTPPDSPGPGVTTYINVRDIDAAVAKITENGGQILMPRAEVPGYGSWALFQAPGGVVQALWQAAMPEPAAAVAAKPRRRVAAKKPARKPAKKAAKRKKAAARRR